MNCCEKFIKTKSFTRIIFCITYIEVYIYIFYYTYPTHTQYELTVIFPLICMFYAFMYTNILLILINSCISFIKHLKKDIHESLDI